MNEELRIVIKAVSDAAQKEIGKVKKELEGVKKAGKESGQVLSAALKSIGKVALGVVATITALTAAVINLTKNTLEFHKTQGRLISGFQSVGMSAAQANETFTQLYRFLGENDTATEAANLLAQITQNEKDLTEWTNILQGVYAKFPSSIPVESLAEAANETIKTGVATGALTDSIVWLGLSEDALNAKLAATNSEAEREALIRSVLNGLYGTAATNYERNNAALLDYNESQARLNIATAEATRYVIPLMTQLNNLGAAIMNVLKPAFEKVIPYIMGFVMWLTEAVKWIGALFGGVSSSSKSVQDVGTKTAAALEKTKKSSSGVVDGLNNIKKSAEAARRAAMGFDELNITPSNKSSSAGVSGSTGALDNLDMGGAIDGITNISDSMADFQKKAEEVKNNISKWMEDWGWALKTIGAILAALSIKNLIVQFATLLGFGEKVAKVLSFGGLIGALKSLWGWFGAVFGLMAEGNGFFAVMGAAFPKLASVIQSVGSKLGWIGLLIAAITSVLTYAIKYWNDIVAIFEGFVSETIAPQVEKIKSLFGEMWSAITSAIPQSWIEWIKGAIAWLGEAFMWLFDIIGGTVFHAVVGTVMSAFNGIVSAIKGVVRVLTGVIQLIVGIIEALVKTIIAIFTGNWDAVMAPLRKIWDGIVNIFVGLYDATIGVVVEFVKGIISWFTNLWDELVGHSIVPDMVEAIIDWFFELPGKLFGMMADFVRGILDKFDELKDKAVGFAKSMWEGIKKPFVGVAEWFKNIFQDAWEGVKNVFSTGGKIFNGIKEGIADVFTTVVNGLISGINTVIAVPFNTINGILNFIKDIKIVGFKPFNNLWGRNPLSVPQIPYLAQGGIVDGATLAMIGERGKEAVVPLENNTEWMDRLADRIANKNSAPTKIVLMLDKKELGWANIKSINSITEQTGTLQLTLA